jgi:flagellar basal-body rod modification protein FlgD
MTTAISATGASPTSATQASRTSLANNFETFLTLLTAQLQNQDPLSPMDTEEFTQQLVQFTGVEQQLRTNELLTSLSDLTRASAGATAVSYLGRSVSAATPNAALGQTGEARWSYSLARAAETSVLKVVNEAGRTVAQLDGARTPGSHEAVWNGRDLSGARAPAGTYRLVVEAVGADRAPVNATITLNGAVDAVDMSGSSPVLTVAGVALPLTAIKNITR